MRPFALLSALACAACSGLPNGVSTFVPYAVEIQSEPAFRHDLAVCRTYALAYKPGLSAVGIGNAAAQGAASNLAGAAISPLVPPLGAAGGGGAELLRELGLLTDAQRRVLIECLRIKGEHSGAYLVLEP